MLLAAINGSFIKVMFRDRERSNFKNFTETCLLISSIIKYYPAFLCKKQNLLFAP